MTTKSDREHLDRLTLQFELLRTKLLRSARALVATEEQRGDLLRSMSSRCHPAALTSLTRDAHQARRNRDLLSIIITDLQRVTAGGDEPDVPSEAERQA